MIRATRWIGLGVLVCTLVLARPAASQSPSEWDAGQLQVSRPELTALQARLAEAAESKAYSRELREQARMQYALVERRLGEGDFQVGDQIALQVEGEEHLTGAFVVAPGVVLKLPLIGDLPLRGVLRSELQAHIVDHLSRYIHNPVIQARSLIRISITGQIGKPGFYMVPSESLVTDALMLAGGPATTSDLSRIAIERSGTPIWAGKPLQEAMTQGRTLDQLSIRAGDQIVLPAIRDASRVPWRQVLTGVGAVALVVRTLSHWF